MFAATLLSLLCASARAAWVANVPPPTMRWYLGANCVGTPGGVVTLSMGCADYIIFGTPLTLLVSKNNGTDKYNIATFVNSGCTGALGVLFVNIPYPGGDAVCTATTTLDRCARAAAPLAAPPPLTLPHTTRARAGCAPRTPIPSPRHHSLKDPSSSAAAPQPGWA